MSNIEEKYIVDDEGNKVAVILSIEHYRNILERIEELEDIKLYDAAKAEDDGGRISLSTYLNKRKSKNG